MSVRMGQVKGMGNITRMKVRNDGYHLGAPPYFAPW